MIFSSPGPHFVLAPRKIFDRLDANCDAPSFFDGRNGFRYFAGGLAFLLLASSVTPVQGRRAGGLPWAWLAWFGLLQGAAQWLDMLALTAGDGRVFTSLRLFLMAVSFCCLLDSVGEDSRPPGRAGAGPLGSAAGLDYGRAAGLGPFRVRQRPVPLCGCRAVCSAAPSSCGRHIAVRRACRRPWELMGEALLAYGVSAA